MLIKLIPLHPHPTVLFTLAFTLQHPQHLPLPNAYHQLLQTLQSSTPALDTPNTLCALDRATWMVECLAEVIIDLNTETVRCIWVDEAIDEWQLASNVNQEQYEECLRQLQSVLHDVDTSGEEAERERMREEWEVRYHAMAQAHAEAQQAYANAQTQAALAAAAAPPVKPTKHKKQRSLLMTLVAQVASMPTIPYFTNDNHPIDLLFHPCRPQRPLTLYRSFPSIID